MVSLPGFSKQDILGALGAVYGAVQTKIAEGDGDIIDQLERFAERVKDDIQSTELYELVAPDIERVVARIGERVDAIR
jgi:hypothetical protein